MKTLENRRPNGVRTLVVCLTILLLGPSAGLAQSKQKGRTPSSGAAAKIVSEGAFQSLEEKGVVTPVSPAIVESGWELSTHLSEVYGEHLAEQLGNGKRKRLAELTKLNGGKPGPGGGVPLERKTKNGKVLEATLLGQEFVIADMSQSLDRVDRAPVWAETYAALYERIGRVLARDDKRRSAILEKGPKPHAGGQKAPDYEKATRELASRWAKMGPERVSNPDGKGARCGACAEAIGASREKDDSASCRKPSPDGLLAKPTWMLASARSCVRDQGPTRGTQVAFALTGAVEAMVGSRGETCVDLSEQHFHYTQKNEWFPIPPNFGDDENAVVDVAGMAELGYDFRYERAWTYNRSPDRQVVAGKGKVAPYGYVDSCKGYGGKPCSDTNHQGQYICAKGERSCGYRATAEPADARIAITGHAPLLDVRSPKRGVELARAFVDVGVPVVASFAVDSSFLDAAQDGWVRGGKSGAEVQGYHSALLEGFVPNSVLPKSAPKADGAGYFVMKNSWGPCVGDAGYWYVPATSLEKSARSLTAITAILARGKDIRKSVPPDEADESEEPGVIVLAASCLGTPEITQPYLTPNGSDPVLYPGDGVDNKVRVEWLSSCQRPNWLNFCVNFVDGPLPLDGELCFEQFDSGHFGSSNSLSVVAALQSNPYGSDIPNFYALKGRHVSLRAKSCIEGENGARDCSAWSPARQMWVALPSPALQWPGKVGEPNDRVLSISTRRPYFFWNVVSDADYYRLVIQGQNSQQLTYDVLDPETPWFDLPSPIPASFGNEITWWVRSCFSRNGASGGSPVPAANDICSRIDYGIDADGESLVHQQRWRVALPAAGEAGIDAGYAFQLVASVFRHPRCTNCHAAGDLPLRGDPPQPHGGDCTSCHNEDNALNAPFVPADALHPWQKAPASMALTADMSAHDICEQILAHKTAQENVTHVEHDDLIIWAWDPGGDREPAPGTHASFVTMLQFWADNGGGCPP